MSLPLHPGQTVENLKTESGPRPEVSTVVSVADSGGSLNNLHFTLKDGANAAFYCWFNVNAAGADPAPGGTGIEVALATNATAAAVASAIQAAIDALGGFIAVLLNSTTVQISNAVNGTATDIGAGDSGMAVSVSVQGQPGNYYPSLNPGSISLTPSAF